MNNFYYWHPQFKPTGCEISNLNLIVRSISSLIYYTRILQRDEETLFQSLVDCVGLLRPDLHCLRSASPRYPRCPDRLHQPTHPKLQALRLPVQVLLVPLHHHLLLWQRVHDSGHNHRKVRLISS